MNLSRAVFLPATLALTLAVSGAALAQTPAPSAAAPPVAEHARHNGFGRILRALNLTPAQHQQIAQLMQRYHRAHPRGSMHDRAAEKQLHASILNVLTPQQRAQFKTHMRAMRAEPVREHGERDDRSGTHMRGPMNGITLSHTQQAQIKTLREQFRAARQQYRRQLLDVLTPQQQAQYQKNTAAMRAGPFRGGHMGLMAGITLTADQQAKIQALMATFRQAHAGSRPDPAARHALRDQVLQVLTAEQRAQFKANAHKMKRGGGPFTPDPTE